MKTNNNTYKVTGFVDRNGNSTTKETTIIMMTGIKGKMNGVSLPFPVSLGQSLNLKIGSVVKETVTYTKIS